MQLKLKDVVISVLEEISRFWKCDCSHYFERLHTAKVEEEFHNIARSIVNHFRDLYNLLYEESLKIFKLKKENCYNEKEENHSDTYFMGLLKHSILESYLGGKEPKWELGL